MKKKNLVFILAAFFLVFAFSFVSAANTCCVQPLEGRWCQDDIPDNECVSGYQKPTSCITYVPCKKGVCYSENSGECSTNTFKAYCESNGNLWFDESKENVVVNGLNVCKEGCCFYGDSTNLLSFAKCKSLSLSQGQGIGVNFDPTITDRDTCLALSGGNEEVACIIPNQFFRDCRRTTKQDCLSTGGSPSRTGLLCTAPQLATDCAPSRETVIYNGKVYFTDTCGNRANIYVKNKFTDLSDYWTNIKQSDDSCTISSSAKFSSTCGNCDETQGTIALSYDFAKLNKANQGMAPPEHGKNVCSSMDCYYDTDGISSTPEIFYKHGESWCAETEGTVHHIKITGETGEFISSDKTRESLTNYVAGVYKNNFVQSFKESYNEYNIPGSRYSKLTCIDGVVYEDSCKDFRQEICMESTMSPTTGNFKVAKCMNNDVLSCGNYTSKTSCEKGLFCKWIYGYRFDGQKVNTIHERVEEYQGSCVPLFAPGLKIWLDPGEESIPEESICTTASFSEIVGYETSFTRSRSNLPDKPYCDTSSGNKNFDHTSDCASNCYVLPSYGRKDAYGDYYSFKDLFDTHKGIKVLGEDLDDACLSDRKVYYCHGKDGPVGGQKADCANKEADRREMPLFFRHDEWQYSIKDRARSMGDCGYKLGIFMTSTNDLDLDLEGVYATQEIAGAKEPKKIYEGDFILQVSLT